MTNHEAIQFLNNMIDQEHGRSIGVEGFYRELCAYHVDALRTAIKALSQQTEYHGTEDMDGLYYCPICQQTTTVVKDGDKCPKCGATMDELSTMEQTEDAISRKQAIYIASGFCHPANIADELAKLPPVTPKQRTGHWIETWLSFWCSECKTQFGGAYKFCPNCGAKMVEPQESEKINCKTTKCENCQNHNYCDYEPQEREEQA